MERVEGLRGEKRKKKTLMDIDNSVEIGGRGGETNGEGRRR